MTKLWAECTWDEKIYIEVDFYISRLLNECQPQCRGLVYPWTHRKPATFTGWVDASKGTSWRFVYDLT